jgi:hypothetical protein
VTEAAAADRVIIFDTTLRDGEQSPGASMNLGQKLQVAKVLRDLGVDVIEAGFAAASSRLAALCEAIASGPTRPGLRLVATVPDLDQATRRALAVGLFNYTWTLLENPDRTPAQNDEMIHAAHASRYHWGEVGEAVNLARGEWQVSRVYAVLGRGEPAVYHARCCLEINEANPSGREDWDLGSAYEALARAYGVAGDRAASDEWRARATAELERIADAEDRQVLEQDLATLP